MTSFKPHTKKKKTAAPELVAADDLYSRCEAAARMALRGLQWSADDRHDCASELVVLVWDRAVKSGKVVSQLATFRRSSVNGGAKVTYTSKSRQKSLDRAPIGQTRTSAIPADLCAWSFLVKRAADYRRAVEASRERDHAAAVDAPVTFDPFIAAPSDDTGGTPHGARRSALDMLRALGMLNDPGAQLESGAKHVPAMSLPHGTPRDVLAHIAGWERVRDRAADLPLGTRLALYRRMATIPTHRGTGVRAHSPSGPLWTLAYAAARAIESDDPAAARMGLDRATVARELDLDAATVRQHIGRAISRIPAARDGYGTRAMWADALDMPLGGVALKPSRSRTVSADQGTRHTGPRERLAPADHAPVTERRLASLKRASVDTWTQGPHRRPEWTRDLPPRTAKRLETAARIRQERAATGVEDSPSAPALKGLG